MVATHSPFTCVGCSTTGSSGIPDFSISQIFNSVREDGYLVGNLNIQGVRAYDPTTSQWSTPDAYKGDVHDPMSQRGYMWNARQALAAAGINPNLLQTGIPTADLFLDLARGAARITPLKAAHHPKDK